MLKSLRYLVIFSLLLPLTSFAQSQAVFETTLKNGLKVFVKEDHRAPVVVSQIWYKVGGSYEPNGITGISHLLEHMMFQGTKRNPKGALTRTVARNGGRENAFTASDFTAYYQVLPADKLPISFKLEADRMRNLSLNQAALRKELQVVMEERRMRTDDNPLHKTYEQFEATAFQSSPYHNPVVGWMHDLQNMKVRDVRRWYRQNYAPNNAIVVVVGDVKPKKVFALAKQYFGHIKKSNVRHTKSHREVKQTGERQIIVKAPAKLPAIIMGYHVPSLNTTKQASDVYALEVLAEILSGGRSARLPKELERKQQIASDVDVSFNLASRLSGLFVINGLPMQGHTVQELKTAILMQIKTLQTELVSKNELARVKVGTIADHTYKRDSIRRQAYEIGSLEAVGLPAHYAKDYVMNIEKVTPEQVRTVARKYLTRDNMTVAILEPQPMDGKKLRGTPMNLGDSHVR